MFHIQKRKDNIILHDSYILISKIYLYVTYIVSDNNHKQTELYMVSLLMSEFPV
jgi:hypothetical protein